MIEDEIAGLIVGEQLSSVEFVQDYLQLHFDGRTLTCYIWPRINTGEEVKTFGTRGYRDSLCGLIACEVESIVLVEQEIFKIYFLGERSMLSLDLSASNPGVTREVAAFNDSLEGTWFIFE